MYAQLSLSWGGRAENPGDVFARGGAAIHHGPPCTVLVSRLSPGVLSGRCTRKVQHHDRCHAMHPRSLENAPNSSVFTAVCVLR